MRNPEPDAGGGEEPAAKSWGAGRVWLAAIWYVAALVLAFPPFGQCPWLVLVFLPPIVRWALTQPRWGRYLATVCGMTWVTWCLILIWLRFIYPPWGWVAMVLLAVALGAFPAMWLAAVRWQAQRLLAASGGRRLLGLLGLAGLWVVLDWVRSWLFSGFPWLPLAAAFWKYPMFLQLAAWTGQSGVTFLIVLGNLALAMNWERAQLGREKLRLVQNWNWYAHSDIAALGLVVLVLGIWSPAYTLGNLTTRHLRLERLLRAGLVQPWTPADLKWDETKELENWRTLVNLTQGLSARDLDVIVWPEAAPPFAVRGPDTEEGRAAVAQLVDQAGRPLILGAVVMDAPKTGTTVSAGDYNSVLVMNPGTGLEPEMYAKQKRVPFGEYVPGRDWFPFLGKVVPLPIDTLKGKWQQPLPLRLGHGETLQAGPLVCYEDVFPYLARQQAQAGADFLVVVTNDAWYGTEGGALQHAAHSVLRAVETRRPLLRCGNDGWSGAIDEYGFATALEQVGGKVMPELIMDDDRVNGTTYFRGAGAVNLYRDRAFAGQETFYVRWGEWFIALSAVLAVLAAWMLRR